MKEVVKLNIIKNKEFEGERPLFKISNSEINKCKFLKGESPLKESQELKITNCSFDSKYPIWHNNKIEIIDSFFSKDSRAAIWYTSSVLMKNCKIEGIKIFRDSKNIKIEDTFMSTDEALWNCSNVKINNSHIKGNYLLMNSSDIELNKFRLDGEYSLQYIKNSTIKNSVLNSKDVFWNSENVSVYDSVLKGKYLGWYSKNLKLVNCKIIGTQPLCYSQNLILENCEMIDTDLCFEYSTVEANINSIIESVKNPISGVIRSKGIKDLILDDIELDFSATRYLNKNI